MIARMSSPPQSRRSTLWIAIALTLITQIRLWPAWSGWHKDDDFKNLRWALAYRDAPWKALTELTPVHGHIRPATLLGHWLGAHLGDGSWVGIHAVHVVLCTGTVVALFLLAERMFGWKEGILAAGTFLLLPGIGELPWWNAWMCSAGEVSLGLLGLWRLHADLREGRWPILPALALVLAGLFKEPGWVLYPMGAAALALHHLRKAPKERTPQARAALLGFPILGVLGLTASFHPQNLERSAQGSNFVTALGKLIDPMLGQAPDAGAGLALPLPLLALGLLSRVGVKGPFLWIGAALAWALGLGLWAADLSTGWLLIAGLPVVLVVACWQWWRGEGSPVDLLLACAGIAVMAPFPFPHPVQMLGGLAGLCIALGMGWSRIELGRWPRWPLLLAGILSMGWAWTRQAEPVDGEFPSQVSAQAKEELLAGIRLAQSIGATHASVPYAGDDRSVVLALAGLQPLTEAPAMVLDGVAIGPGQPIHDLLQGHPVPRTNLRHRQVPGSQPLITLQPGSYLLSVSGPAQTRGTWVEVYGDCGKLTLGPGASASEEIRHLRVDSPCVLEMRADTQAPPEVHLSALTAARISYRSADPSTQHQFLQSHL